MTHNPISGKSVGTMMGRQERALGVKVNNFSVESREGEYLHTSINESAF